MLPWWEEHLRIYSKSFIRLIIKNLQAINTNSCSSRSSSLLMTLALFATLIYRASYLSFSHRKENEFQCFIMWIMWTDMEKSSATLDAGDENNWRYSDRIGVGWSLKFFKFKQNMMKFLKNFLLWWVNEWSGSFWFIAFHSNESDDSRWKGWQKHEKVKACNILSTLREKKCQEFLIVLVSPSFFGLIFLLTFVPFNLLLYLRLWWRLKVIWWQLWKKFDVKHVRLTKRQPLYTLAFHWFYGKVQFELLEFYNSKKIKGYVLYWPTRWTDEVRSNKDKLVQKTPVTLMARVVSLIFFKWFCCSMKLYVKVAAMPYQFYQGFR